MRWLVRAVMRVIKLMDAQTKEQKILKEWLFKHGGGATTVHNIIMVNSR